MDLAVDLLLQIILSLDRKWIKAPDALHLSLCFKCWLKGSDTLSQVVTSAEGFCK